MRTHARRHYIEVLGRINCTLGIKCDMSQPCSFPMMATTEGTGEVVKVACEYATPTSELLLRSLYMTFCSSAHVIYMVVVLKDVKVLAIVRMMVHTSS